jgi:hypothetical protein
MPGCVTGGREVYFATPVVKRRLHPEGKLTRDDLCLRIHIDGKYREVSMIEYPDTDIGSVQVNIT